MILIVQNGVEGIFDAVFLDRITLPVCHSCIVKSLYQLCCGFIGEIRQNFLQIFGSSIVDNGIVFLFREGEKCIANRFIGDCFLGVAIDRSQFCFAKCHRKRFIILPWKISLLALQMSAKQSDCQFLSDIFALLHSSGKRIEFCFMQTAAIDSFFTGFVSVQIAVFKENISDVFDLVPGKRCFCNVCCQIFL